MKFNELDIEEFTDYIKTLENEDLYQILNNYINYRIVKNKLLTKEELEQFPDFVTLLKKKLNEERKINRALFRCRDLLILSKDNIYKTNNYKILKEIENKRTEQRNENEFSNQICILLNNAMCCITIKIFEKQIMSYLNKELSIEAKYNIVKLLNSYSYKEFSKKDQDKMYKLLEKLNYEINNTIIYGNKFINELEKEIINSTLLEEYITKIEISCDKEININEFQILEKICELFRKDNYLRIKFDNIANYIKLYNRLEGLYEKTSKKLNRDCKRKKKIKSGEIFLSNQDPKKLISSLNTTSDKLEFATEPRIIAIDDTITSDKDGAFSIQKFDDIYILNVYITDVPTFLRDNQKLCRFAYEKGTSLYICNFSKDIRNYNIDMLPEPLSHNLLSLNQGHPTNTIAFNFIFGENGELYSSSVSRKRVKVTDAPNPTQAKILLNSQEYYGSLQDDLRDYQDLCRKVSQTSNDRLLSSLNVDTIGDLVGFTSVLVNYYLGHESEFTIYREDGQYTKDYVKDPYTHSATPLRRFVSDINLAFFLNQNEIVNFSDKNLAYVERNIDEIIEHLNEQTYLQKFIDNNSNFVKKYIKK